MDKCKYKMIDVDGNVHAYWMFLNFFVGRCSNCGYVEETDLAHEPSVCKGCNAIMDYDGWVEQNA